MLHRELVRASMVSADLLCWSVLRQIAGGDITNRNLWLAENMLETLVENRTWLEKFPVLIGSVIFTYLRILEDHFPSHLSNLRQKEVLIFILHKFNVAKFDNCHSYLIKLCNTLGQLCSQLNPRPLCQCDYESGSWNGP